jgi:hypothetical protein
MIRIGMQWAAISALVGCNEPLVVCPQGSCPGEDAAEPPPDSGVVDPPDTGVPDVGPNYNEAFHAGGFDTLPGGTALGYGDITGFGGFMRQKDGTTDVLLSVEGLNPGIMYAVHVHANRCDSAEGGPHYKIDPNIADTVEANEIWPNITTDANGGAIGYLRAQHYIRNDANAIVIHQPMTNERIACATLYPNADVTAQGSFYDIPGAMSGITGTATLRRYAGGTVARVRLSGNFTNAAPYPVHVHAKRCADEMGGPHYKIDPSIMDTMEMNEIWPNAMHDTTTATGADATPHIARYDAWSMVVHDPVSNNRILCADLKW